MSRFGKSLSSVSKNLGNFTRVQVHSGDASRQVLLTISLGYTLIPDGTFSGLSIADMDRVSVKIEHPLQDEVSLLLSQSDSVAAMLYPGEYRRPITAHSLLKPDTHVFVARIDGKAVGLCVLFDRNDRTMELKRMIVDDKTRGAGVGTALLREAEAQAQEFSANDMLLEVGIRNTEAQQLYRRQGYQACEPFPPYSATPISLFMRRTLTTVVS